MTNLSNTFKYISHFRHAGHQVGRKVGDMLEVLTYAAISNDPQLHARLHIEPKLFGISDAGHKVEFTLNQSARFDEHNTPAPLKGGSIEDPSDVIGFIECKKVGVEQTVNSTFKKAHAKHDNKSFFVPYDTDFIVKFQPRGMDCKAIYTVSILRDNITIKDELNNTILDEEYEAGHRIIFTLSTCGQSEVLGNDESLRDKAYTLKNCRILDIYAKLDDGISCVLNDCLSGPQTPEKAKQASFVALDVRRKRFGTFDMRDNEQEMISVLILTEFSHWEAKSQNMIRTCIDRNLIVSDDIIVEAFIKFESQFGEDFYNKISKDAFEQNRDVNSLAKSIVASRENKIFTDMDTGDLVRISYANNRLSIE